MPDTLQSRCPHCEKVLKLKSEAAFGRTVPCPGCGTTFTIKPFTPPPEPPAKAPARRAAASGAVKKRSPRPAPADDEWQETGDEYDYQDLDYEDYQDDAPADDEYDEPAPRRATRTASKSSKSKKKKKSAGVPGWLLGAGLGVAGVAVLGLLIGGVVYAVRNLGGNRIDLAWLPADTQMVVRIDVKGMWNSEMLAPVRDSSAVKQALTSGASQFPVKFEDLDSVTIGGSDLSDMIQQRNPMFGMGPGTQRVVRTADPKMLVVVRVSTPLADNAFDALPNVTSQQHGSTKYYSMPASPSGEVFAPVDSTTLLIGAPALVTAAIDRGPKAVRMRRFDPIDPTQHIIFAAAPENPLKKTPTGAGFNAAQRLSQKLDETSKAMFLGLSLTSDINLAVLFECFGSAEAGELKTSFEEALGELKPQLETMGASPFMPPAVTALMDSFKQGLQSVKATQSGSSVEVTGRIPGTFVASLKEMAEQFGTAPQLIPPPGGVIPPPSVPPGSLGAGFTPDQQEQQEIKALQDGNQEILDETQKIRGQVRQATGGIQRMIPGGAGSEIPKEPGQP